MLLLNRSDIESVFSMKAAIAANKEAFALASSGEAVVPLRTSLRSDTVDGTFLFMPSYTKKLNKAALKTVNVFPGNAAAGLDVTRGVILLMDGETGAFLAMLDGTCVTALRTGAAAMRNVQATIAGGHVMLPGAEKRARLQQERGKKGSFRKGYE